MKVSEFLVHTSYALRGTDDDAPAFGSDEANYWIATLNRKKNELYEDVTKQWRNTHGILSLGTISASTAPEYDTDDTYLSASDTVYVVTTAGQTIYYDVIQPQARNPQKRQVYVGGMDPQVLHFTNEIISTEDIIGGTLYLPGFYMPDDVSRANDTLPFLDPFWGVMAAAAEIAGNDIVYEDKEANLTAKANNLHRLMVKKNRGGTYGNPRTTPISVKRIRSPRVK